VVQGGSTISQQVIKNTLLTPKKNLLRKLQEAILAYELNRRYQKNEIMEMYLNSAYFGEGAFGLENAAQAYFGKRAAELTPAESTLLVALLPAPSNLSPLSNGLDDARVRQRLVLNQMVEEGYITGSEANSIFNQSLHFSPISDEVNQIAPHFALYIRNQLINQYGEDHVIRSGFTVRTTLNQDWQKTAQAVVANQVSRLERNRATNGAAIVLAPKTGEILAMVGSVSWYNTQFGKMNMTTAPRQSGSAFKPLVYSLALEQRLVTPATVLQDIPKEYPGKYKPVNYDRNFRGPVTVRRALANSLNVPSVELMYRLGLPLVLAHAKNLGISTLGTDTSAYGLSLVLGSGEVSLLELSAAYGVFANEGTYVKPVSILKITDKYGKIIKENHQESHRIMRSDTAFLINSILSDQNTRREIFGTSLNISKTAAVKTGTTSSYKDALTVGYTHDVVIGVWVGNNDNRPMDLVAGSLGAAPIWRSLMESYLGNLPDKPFNIPATVETATVCPYVGHNTSLAAVTMYTEYFFRGTKPASLCQHRPIPNEPSQGPDNPEEDKDKDEDEDNPPVPAATPPEPTPPPPLEWNDDE
jgi:penicillin-binding protein 1C